MKNDEAKIEKLVILETKRIRKKRPALQAIDVTCEENSKGSFFSKVKARMRNKTIVVKEESRCPETAIRKVFNNLSVLLRKKSKKNPKKTSFQFDFEEVTA